MKSAKHRRSLASAALASVLCAAPGSGAFYMPLPVTDFAAQAQAGQLLKTAKTMLVMAASMQQTLESIEAIVDGGFIGILSQVPLPGGWLVDAGRTAILTGKVPYTALASGLLNVSELPAGQTNLIARAIDGLSKGTTPLEIAKNIGLSSIDFSSLSAGEQAMAQTFVTIAGEGNPDARIAAVARLAQSHAMGATGELLAQSDTPDWVKNAVATGSSNEIWKSGDNANGMGKEPRSSPSSRACESTHWKRSKPAPSLADGDPERRSAHRERARRTRLTSGRIGRVERRRAHSEISTRDRNERRAKSSRTACNERNGKP